MPWIFILFLAFGIFSQKTFAGPCVEQLARTASAHHMEGCEEICQMTQGLKNRFDSYCGESKKKTPRQCQEEHETLEHAVTLVFGCAGYFEGSDKRNVEIRKSVDQFFQAWKDRDPKLKKLDSTGTLSLFALRVDGLAHGMGIFKGQESALFQKRFTFGSWPKPDSFEAFNWEKLGWGQSTFSLKKEPVIAMPVVQPSVAAAPKAIGLVATIYPGITSEIKELCEKKANQLGGASGKDLQAALDAVHAQVVQDLRLSSLDKNARNEIRDSYLKCTGRDSLPKQGGNPGMTIEKFEFPKNPAASKVLDGGLFKIGNFRYNYAIRDILGISEDSSPEGLIEGLKAVNYAVSEGSEKLKAFPDCVAFVESLKKFFPPKKLMQGLERLQREKATRDENSLKRDTAFLEMLDREIMPLWQRDQSFIDWKSDLASLASKISKNDPPLSSEEINSVESACYTQQELACSFIKSFIKIARIDENIANLAKEIENGVTTCSETSRQCAAFMSSCSGENSPSGTRQAVPLPFPEKSFDAFLGVLVPQAFFEQPRQAKIKSIEESLSTIDKELDNLPGDGESISDYDFRRLAPTQKTPFGNEYDILKQLQGHDEAILNPSCDSFLAALARRTFQVEWARLLPEFYSPGGQGAIIKRRIEYARSMFTRLRSSCSQLDGGISQVNQQIKDILASPQVGDDEKKKIIELQTQPKSFKAQ